MKKTTLTRPLQPQPVAPHQAHPVVFKVLLYNATCNHFDASNLCELRLKSSSSSAQSLNLIGYCVSGIVEFFINNASAL